MASTGTTVVPTKARLSALEAGFDDAANHARHERVCACVCADCDGWSRSTELKHHKVWGVRTRERRSLPPEAPSSVGLVAGT